MTAHVTNSRMHDTMRRIFVRTHWLRKLARRPAVGAATNGGGEWISDVTVR